MYVVELPRLKIVAVGAYALVGVHSVWLSGAFHRGVSSRVGCAGEGECGVLRAVRGQSAVSTGRGV